jgi:hypothetical protein
MVAIGTLLTKATTVKLVTKDYLTESSCFMTDFNQTGCVNRF